jgi:uncharacterized protein (DUF58 family)
VRRRIDGEWWAALAGLVLAGVGWGVHALSLALVGMLGALTAVVLWVWQHESLTAVTYRRTVGQARATFGEEVALDLEIVNDKLLPLTWLHIGDVVPRDLTISGGTMAMSRSDVRRELQQLLPMLPYQRVRRHLTIVCDRRGEHTFGPARLRSGNPIGYRQQFATVAERAELLVYPKVFRILSPPVASRVPLGDYRARSELLGDPSRPAGVREYRAGDPLRHIDWRATARGQGLLVRMFEPTSTLKVAVFADLRLPNFGRMGDDADQLEFAVAVAASVVADLVGRGVATGLYSSGTVKGHAVVREPTSAPGALAEMLELLARASPYGRTSIADLLIAEGGRLRRGASLVVMAADFPEPTLIALGELRRRLPVTAIWVAGDHGRPPPAGLVDVTREVTYRRDWKDQGILDMA